MHKYSDEELIIIYRTTNGDQRRKAFELLYLRHADSLKNYFFLALGNDYEKAKDFVHDLFVKILESPEKFNPTRAFKPWMFRIASNMCKNEYRKQVVVNKYRDHIHYSAPDHEYLNENEIKLHDCLRRVSQEHRSILVLRFKIKLSIKEIATIYSCPEGTIKSRLFYATRELSEYYKR